MLLGSVLGEDWHPRLCPYHELRMEAGLGQRHSRTLSHALAQDAWGWTGIRIHLRDRRLTSVTTAARTGPQVSAIQGPLHSITDTVNYYLYP